MSNSAILLSTFSLSYQTGHIINDYIPGDRVSQGGPARQAFTTVATTKTTKTKNCV